MTTGACPYWHVPVVSLSKSHSKEGLGPLLRNVERVASLEKRTLIRPRNSLLILTVSRSYQRSDLEINKTHAVIHIHSFYCDQVDVTLNSKQDPSLFLSLTALQ